MDQRRVFERSGERTETRLGQPNSFACEFREILFHEARFKYHGTGEYPHPAGPIILK